MGMEVHHPAVLAAVLQVQLLAVAAALQAAKAAANSARRRQWGVGMPHEHVPSSRRVPCHTLLQGRTARTLSHAAGHGTNTSTCPEQLASSL